MHQSVEGEAIGGFEACIGRAKISKCTRASHIYVADMWNNRVLYYPAGQTSATRVYGQPDFYTNTNNYGGISATIAICACLDRVGGVSRADCCVGRGETPLLQAINIYANCYSLWGPTSVAVNKTGDVYISDTNNMWVTRPKL